MDAVTRRRFLLASGVAGAGALTTGVGVLTFSQLLDLTTPDRPAGPGRQAAGTLVMVTLYGGNDGLNTVIPYADPAYQLARPTLSYAPEQVLALDDALGLNPRLPGLRRLWDEKRLGIVLGVGYPKPDRSHFRSMDIWQTASPAGPVHTGWVGRWLDGTKAPAEAAVSFEPVLPPLLAGETRAGACVRLSGLRLPTGIDTGMIAGLGRTDDDELPLQARAASAYADLLRVDGVVRGAERATGQPDAGDGAILPATGTGGGNALAAQLVLVARCIEAGVPTRVYSVSLGGFDLHAQERAGHERLLANLDDALTAFVSRMARTVAGRPVTVVVYSEFGRRVQANASDGTDHGTAGPVFLLGEQVAAGFHGEQPSLRDLDAGDLKATTDFRDVFGAVLEAVLQADPARYIQDYRLRLLPLFRPN